MAHKRKCLEAPLSAPELVVYNAMLVVLEIRGVQLTARQEPGLRVIARAVAQQVQNVA
jgi:hypothetical protein